MKLTVFGKYGPYPCDGGATSGYHLEGSDYSLAFEMGSGVFARLNAAKRVEGLDALILSHLHFDHISDVGVLNYYLESLARKGLYNGKLRVVLPRVDCPALTAISSMQYLQLDFVSEGDVREFGSVRVEFFSVKHPVPCLGFKAYDGDKVFLYSADTDLCASLSERLSGATLALLDGAFLGEQYRAGGPHMSLEICSLLARENNVKALISHVIPTNSILEMKEIISNNPLCRIVEEGESYEIE